MRRHGKRVSAVDAELLAFLAGLERGGLRAVAPPQSLIQLAARALAKVPACAHLQPDDLVSELVLRLIDRIDHGKPPLGSDVESVRGVLRHRLHQLAVDQAPSRPVLKELSGHVRRVLLEGPPQGCARPEAIDRQGRLDYRRVAQAVGWAQSEPAAPRPPALLARWLAREFGLMTEHVPVEAAEQLAAVGGADLSALPLAHRLAGALGPEACRMLGLKLAGAHLRDLADALQCSVTTAHRRVSEVEATLAAAVHAEQATPSQVRSVLRLFATQAVVRSEPAPEKPRRAMSGPARAERKVAGVAPGTDASA